jgi:F0F1-type ATP synthase alpha subunit
MDCPNSSGSCNVNPKLSITRVGSRAYHRAMADLAPQVRLDLAQAEDARK